MILTSDESPLPTGKVNLEEASWIASLVNLGGSIGTLFFGVITNKFGRKKPLIVITVPTIVSHIIIFALELLSNFQKFIFCFSFQISWLLVLYAQNVYYLYAARFLNGFTGASYFIMVPLFFTEIANDR